MSSWEVLFWTPLPGYPCCSKFYLALVYSTFTNVLYSIRSKELLGTAYSAIFQVSYTKSAKKALWLCSVSEPRATYAHLFSIDFVLPSGICFNGLRLIICNNINSRHLLKEQSRTPHAEGQENSSVRWSGTRRARTVTYKSNVISQCGAFCVCALSHAPWQTLPLFV